MDLRAVRGMHDLYGETAQKWHFLEDLFRRTMADFGYQEIRTPVLEKKEVFTQTVGDDTDIVEKQMYQIAPRAVPGAPSGAAPTGEEETMVLRPEGTAAFLRAIAEHQLHLPGNPQRYYYYLPMFRHERPQKGRLRQFHQMGAEFIAEDSPYADAEVIAMLDLFFKRCGVTQYELELNSLGSAECRRNYKALLQAFFAPKRDQLCPECQKRFDRAPLRILDCKNETCKQLREGAPLLLDHLDPESHAHFETVKRQLTAAGVTFRINPLIVRGLDYYCRTAFEFTSNLLGAQSALGGGGRYDGVASRFGVENLPAVGWALGVERLVLALEQREAKGIPLRRPFAFLAPMGQPALDHLFPLSMQLRKSGIPVDIAYAPDKKLKWLLKQADRSRAAFALIVGEDEWQRGEAVWKNMGDSSQETISLAALPAALDEKWRKWRENATQAH